MQFVNIKGDESKEAATLITTITHFEHYFFNNLLIWIFGLWTFHCKLPKIPLQTLSPSDIVLLV